MPPKALIEAAGLHAAIKCLTGRGSTALGAYTGEVEILKAGGETRYLTLTIVYCDEHVGYTAESWVMEFRDIMVQEYGFSPVVRKVRDCSIEVDPIIVTPVGRVEGLPTDPGHLYEQLKRLLDRLRNISGLQGA